MQEDHHYRNLLVMAVLSFIAMYALMYAMVDTLANVYMNVNQVYMAGLMTAPMLSIELLVMHAMYRNKRANTVILVVGAMGLIACFSFIRMQTAVSDKQFLRSMIPHHAAAILMCGRAPLQDPEIRGLCQRIMTSQQSEIDEMKAKLSIFDKKLGPAGGV
jgi:peptidoglycan/LPS O-acetylase OafA/YrhL